MAIYFSSCTGLLQYDSPKEEKLNREVKLNFDEKNGLNGDHKNAEQLLKDKEYVYKKKAFKRFMFVWKCMIGI